MGECTNDYNDQKNGALSEVNSEVSRQPLEDKGAHADDRFNEDTNRQQKANSNTDIRQQSVHRMDRIRNPVRLRQGLGGRGGFGHWSYSFLST